MRPATTSPVSSRTSPGPDRSILCSQSSPCFLWIVLGRRPLMLLGSFGMAAVYLVLGFCYHSKVTGLPVLLLVLAAIACYSMSLAPVTWVIISEIFPNRIRGAAMSLAVMASGARLHSHLYVPDSERVAGRFGNILALRIHLRCWRDFRAAKAA